jgi:hypothetical protein
MNYMPSCIQNLIWSKMGTLFRSLEPVWKPDSSSLDKSISQQLTKRNNFIRWNGFFTHHF